MKTILCNLLTTVLVLLVTASYGQPKRETFRSTDRQVLIEQLASFEMQNLFDAARPGHVYYTNRKEERDRLNYNLLFDLFYYESRQGNRILERPAEIDSIHVGGSLFKFFPDKGYFEVVTASPGQLLLIKHGIDISSETVAVGPYGTTSRAASIDAVQSLVGTGDADIVDRTITVNNPGGQELHISLRREENFHLLKNGEPLNVRNRRILLREFSEYRSELRGFLRQHSIDFDREADMIVLAGFINSLQE